MQEVDKASNRTQIMVGRREGVRKMRTVIGLEKKTEMASLESGETNRGHLVTGKGFKEPSLRCQQIFPATTGGARKKGRNKKQNKEPPSWNLSKRAQTGPRD